MTTGLLDMMDRVELEGVLAHELSHIKNNDILVATMAVTMVGLLALVSDWFIRLMWWNGGRRGRNDPQGGATPYLTFIGFGLLILAPLIAKLLQLAVSRSRESLADVSAVEMTRYPPGLISALEKPRRQHGGARQFTGHGPPLDRVADRSGRARGSALEMEPDVRHAPAARRPHQRPARALSTSSVGIHHLCRRGRHAWSMTASHLARRPVGGSRRGRLVPQVALVVLTLVLASCSRGDKNDDAVTTTTKAPSTTLAPSTTEPATGPVAPLTGLRVTDGSLLARPALAVKVDNLDNASQSAVPQAGLAEADMVYEVIVEGNITRFVAVFHSHAAGRVGPVRSARTTDLSLLQPFGKILFAWSGGNDGVRAAVQATYHLLDVGHDNLPASYHRDPAASGPAPTSSSMPTTCGGPPKPTGWPRRSRSSATARRARLSRPPPKPPRGSISPGARAVPRWPGGGMPRPSPTCGPSGVGPTTTPRATASPPRTWWSW